jgi:DNA-directed RNA polymerase subunit RPC12/RpoP/drug/metabolite transporter (DMT)-like permease
MPTCSKCGAEIEKDDLFCPYCGAQLTTQPSKEYEKETYVHGRDVCFEVERRRDYTGLISFGIFLVIIGIVFIANPNVTSNFSSWTEQMTKAKSLSRPPQDLINSAALFFGLIGLSDFFLAAVRFIAHRVTRRALSNILSGAALVLFSYLIYLYGRHELTWQVALATEVVFCGLLVIVYSTLHYLFPKKLR